MFQPNQVYIIYDPNTDVFTTADAPPPESGEYVRGSGARWHIVGSARTEGEAEKYITNLRQTYDGWGGRGT